MPPRQFVPRIWREEPEPDNPFAIWAVFCHGYDVFGEMLGNSGWTGMLYLLLRLLGAAAHALEQQGYGYKRFPF